MFERTAQICAVFAPSVYCVCLFATVLEHSARARAPPLHFSSLAHVAVCLSVSVCVCLFQVGHVQQRCPLALSRPKLNARGFARARVSNDSHTSVRALEHPSERVACASVSSDYGSVSAQGGQPQFEIFRNKKNI